jgi:hypothetical protein
MTTIARPNGWVVVEDDPATTLTYAARVHPAPLTASVPHRDPTLGSLVVVITNGTPSDVEVASVIFTITVGQPGIEGVPLTPTTEGVKAEVSDTTTWTFSGPSSVITSGTADYVLGPATGSTATLAAGASVYVEIYDFETVRVVSTSSVEIAEAIGTSEPVFTSFDVSTFPDGFSFDGLTVNVPSGSALVPVAQVPAGTAVTLTWNSSVVDTASQTVYWSNATAGQQQKTPTKLGEWSTPPLTSDTVFVVVVKAQGSGDEPLEAALATGVSVQNPALVAGSVETPELTAGSAAVNGPLTANGVLTADEAFVEGSIQASRATVMSADGGSALEGLVDLQADGGTAILAVNASNIVPTAQFINRTAHEENWPSGVVAGVLSPNDWGFSTNGRIAGESVAVSHVETRNGHRVVTSPIVLMPEVHVSGRARLEGGRATVELDPEVADMLVHDGDEPYRVLVTPTTRCNGLAVTSKQAQSFTVEELLDGSSDAELDWLLIGRKRRELGSSEADVLPDSLPDVTEPPVPPRE